MITMLITKEEKIARLRLIRSRGIGNSGYWSLIRLYGSAEIAIQHVSEIMRELGKRFDLVGESKLNQEIESVKKIGGYFVFFEDELYPPMLREIDSPPPVLTFLGNKTAVINMLKQRMLAVIGSRNATLNGMRFCHAICNELSAKSIGIVSGLARGMDTSAHNGSINNGTIAILAGGINIIYPRENEKLYHAIVEHGGIYAEMPYDQYPSASLFPRRNGIIAGMSDGVLVVEAAEKSGSLITVNFAKSFKRKIFAVPNSPLDVRSHGGNELIKQGAHVVTSANDVLEAFFGSNSRNMSFQENMCMASKFEHRVTCSSVAEIKQKILQLIDSYSITIDDIMECIDAKPERILRAIVELELSGKIRRTFGHAIIYCGSSKPASRPN